MQRAAIGFFLGEFPADPTQEDGLPVRLFFSLLLVEAPCYAALLRHYFAAPTPPLILPPQQQQQQQCQLQQQQQRHQHSSFKAEWRLENQEEEKSGSGEEEVLEVEDKDKEEQGEEQDRTSPPSTTFSLVNHRLIGAQNSSLRQRQQKREQQRERRQSDRNCHRQDKRRSAASGGSGSGDEEAALSAPTTTLIASDGRGESSSSSSSSPPSSPPSDRIASHTRPHDHSARPSTVISGSMGRSSSDGSQRGVYLALFCDVLRLHDVLPPHLDLPPPAAKRHLKCRHKPLADSFSAAMAHIRPPSSSASFSSCSSDSVSPSRQAPSEGDEQKEGAVGARMAKNADGEVKGDDEGKVGDGDVELSEVA